MLLIGCKPPGRHTEQHDVFFTIADYFSETEEDVKTFWPEASKIHIDAWREVTNVDGYRISVIQKESARVNGDNLKLFFINLGGYKKGQFEEFHYKVLIVAESLSEANRKAKESTFCLHPPGLSKDSLPHIDDKYGIDVDDVCEVKDILPAYLKEQYVLQISEIIFEEAEQGEDGMNLGYQRYEKMKK